MDTKFGIFLILFFCFMFSACEKTIEEKTLDAAKESKSEIKQRGPECSQFKPDGTPKVKGGCTKKEWDDWYKTH